MIGLESLIEPSNSPWPSDGRPAIFVLDTNRSLEQRLLENWIEHHRPDGAECHKVVLALGDDRKPLQSLGLSNAISSSGDAIVIPLRIAWTPSDKAYASGPRLRHLIQGPERRPGWLRGRRILKRHPERAHLIKGTPDTVTAMGGRFTSKYDLAPEQRPEDFAVFVARQAAIVLDMAERRLQGGRYKVPRYIAQSLRNNQEFKARLYDIANQEERSRSDVVGEVNEYFKEMISIPTSFWLDVWIKFCNVCLGLGYEPRLHYSAEDLERVRSRGWALADSELEPGLIAVAAPVFAADGSVVASMSISGPTLRMTREVTHEYAQLLVEAAAETSAILGFHGSGDAESTSVTQAGGRVGAA